MAIWCTCLGDSQNGQTTLSIVMASVSLKIPWNTVWFYLNFGVFFFISGIVRSVDAQTRKLYLLSTISLAEMQHVNVLAIGAIPLPSAVFLNQHMQVRGAVPYVYNSDNFIGSKQVAQHIFRAESKSNNKPIKLMEH